MVVILDLCAMTKHSFQVTLESTADEKDLGVVVDEGLHFHLHVCKAVSKASHMLGLVRTTFSCLDESTVPRYRRDQLEIEKIQRRALRVTRND